MRLDYGALSILLLYLHCADSFKHKTFRGFGKRTRQLDFSAEDTEIFTSVALRASLLGLASFLMMADTRSFVKDTFRSIDMATDDQIRKLYKVDNLTKGMNETNVKLVIFVITAWVTLIAYLGGFNTTS